MLVLSIGLSVASTLISWLSTSRESRQWVDHLYKSTGFCLVVGLTLTFILHVFGQEGQPVPRVLPLLIVMVAGTINLIESEVDKETELSPPKALTLGVYFIVHCLLMRCLIQRGSGYYLLLVSWVVAPALAYGVTLGDKSKRRIATGAITRAVNGIARNMRMGA